MRFSSVSLGLLLACGGGEGDLRPKKTTSSVVPLPTCGDGVIDPGEACDDGDANSDTDPDACRANCTAPFCGDGVQDSSEACDDANAWGGDGCLPSCQTEAGPFEAEPNDQFGLSTPLPADGEIAGGLPAFDRDCFTVSVGDNAWLEASLMPSGLAGCPELALLELVDDQDVVTATGAIDEQTGCAQLGPEERARYLEAGDYAVCVTGLFDSAIPAYRLRVVLHDDSCELTDPPDSDEDLDLDGVADNCDDDMDGDGLANTMDTCPRVANGPDTGPRTTNENGYIGTWLSLGPIEDVSAATQCLPDYTEHLGDDANASPTLGESAAGLQWHALLSPDDLMALQTIYAGSSTPREGYFVSYVWSDTQRSVDLAIGQDDGARVWFNNVYLGEVSECQGASADDYLYPVTLQVGWNQVTVRVYDGGGNWGLYTRFKEGSTPLTDLELALHPSGLQMFDQTDSDGDGLGDVCDPTPSG